MNSFTSSNPAFPYESSFAREQLGIPDAPEIHLAITGLAELLLPLAQASKLDERLQRIQVLRVASSAVLFGWPLSTAQEEARAHLDLPPVHGGMRPKPWVTNEKNWLAETASQLGKEGVVVNPRFQYQRSNYGWRAIA